MLISKVAVGLRRSTILELLTGFGLVHTWFVRYLLALFAYVCLK